MPYEIDWPIPDHLIRVTNHGDIYYDEFIQMLRDINREIRQSNAQGIQPHVIVDATNQGKTINAREMWRANQELRTSILDPGQQMHDIISWTAFVSHNRLLVFITTLMAQFMNFRIHFTRTYDDALAFLHATDPTLAQHDNTAQP